MKKIIRVMLLLFVSALLVSCGKKHPIDKFKEEMNNADNFQMTVAMSDIPLLGSITITTKVDGNIEYVGPILGVEEQYLEKTDDGIYLYNKDEDGKWYKEKTELDIDEITNSFSEEDLLELLDSSNYEKVEGEENAFKQKKDIVFDTYDEVTIYIGENVYILEMNATLEGITIKTKITISKIGEIKLTLPTIE